MDTGTLIFFGILTIASLFLGVSAFFGKKADAYVPPYFSSRLLMMGILLVVIFSVSFLRTPMTEANDYLISYICLFIGFVFLVASIAIAVSNRANAAWWRLTRKVEQGSERKHLVFVLILLAFGFFFSFFLFYPPFLSIG